MRRPNPASSRRTNSKLLRTVKKHPVRTAGIAAGAVLGAALIGKAVNTAAKGTRIKAAGSAASDVTGAARKRGGRAGSRARMTRAAKKK